MPPSGEQTRDRILDAAHRLSLRRGFGATSIDRVIEAAEVSKGAFFYHFQNRAELGHALIARYARVEEALADELLSKAERLARDPLQQLLIFVGLFEDLFRDAEVSHPGCLFASFAYEMEVYDQRTGGLVLDALVRARSMLVAKLEEVVEVHPPGEEIDLEALADLYTSIFEGAFVLARTFNDSEIVARQLALYRDYLERVFGAR